MRSASHHRKWFRIGSWGIPAALLALALVEACGQTVEVGVDDALTTGGVGGGGSLSSSGTAGIGGSMSAGAPPCATTECRGSTYLCGDCIDNDGDGLIDALDPDCLGPCDDDELGLSTGLTGNLSEACRQDCYFDGNNGPGNDKCQWSFSCDPLSVAPNYPPSGQPRCQYGAVMGVDCASLHAEQPAACTDVCLPLVPNGCDCFGCCELPGGSNDFHYIGIGRGEEGCQRDNLDDPLACPPCTPVTSCFNACDKCETCVDKLPDPSCTPGSSCPNGERECGPDAPCDFGDYCVTGCCVRAPKPT